jgi:hypothetical protein
MYFIVFIYLIRIDPASACVLASSLKAVARFSVTFCGNAERNYG